MTHKKNIVSPGVGFTLVELLIACSIFLVVMSTIYSAFHSGVFGYRNIDETINAWQSARYILERINLELRNSFSYSAQDSRFLGSKNDISFLALVDTFAPGGTLEEDYASVSYKLEGLKLIRLCRKGQDSLKEKSETQPEELYSNIEQMSFAYGYIDESGSLQFQDSWPGQGSPQEAKKLPVAVKVDLTLKNRMKDNFTRTIFLPLAEAK